VIPHAFADAGIVTLHRRAEPKKTKGDINMRTRIVARLFAVLVGTTGLVGTSQAGYTGLTIFGDSLSDTGNVLSLTTVSGGFPFPTFPGAAGRFSNGPVWTETLAAGLGIPGGAVSSNLLFTNGAPPFPPIPVVPIGPQGGTNFAYGGARTGLGGAAGATTGIFGQLAAWNGGAFGTSLSRAADPNALYVLMAGANDLRDARTANPGSTTADQVARAEAVGRTVGNIANAMGLLALSGARHFMVSTLPDLGKTPEAAFLGTIAASTELTLAFNRELAAATETLELFFQVSRHVDLDIRTLDFYGLTEDIYADATTNNGARYGITNVTTPCIKAGPFSQQFFAPDAVGTACDVSAFSDPLHPTAAFHELLGQLAVSTAIPEPAGLALVVCGLFGVVMVRRRRMV
jgi:phospholipase/lecithinase/hemolysin